MADVQLIFFFVVFPQQLQTDDGPPRPARLLFGRFYSHGQIHVLINF